MQTQSQQNHCVDHQCIHHTDAPGIDISPVLGHAVHRVEARKQPVDASAGRPQGRNGGHPRHRAGGVAVGAVHQFLRALHQGPGQNPSQKLHQILHRQTGVAQGAEDQQQRRENGQHDKVRRVGRPLGNMHFPNGLGHVKRLADKTAPGELLHPCPSRKYLHPKRKRPQPSAAGTFSSGSSE